jgi:hypothetical protein
MAHVEANGSPVNWPNLNGVSDTYTEGRTYCD